MGTPRKFLGAPRIFFLEIPDATPTMEQVLALPWNGYYLEENERTRVLYVKSWVENFHEFAYYCPFCVEKVNKSGEPRKGTKHKIHRHGLQGFFETIMDGTPIFMERVPHCLQESCSWFFDGEPNDVCHVRTWVTNEIRDINAVMHDL